ncbi:MAG: flagellar protein FlgN [Desulfobacteraceae bacterium]|nr:flagellar protein FlgN [Desulfobacteraceae bacterium]
MEKITSDIKDLLNEKLGLYKQLNALLKEEREFIVNIDIGALWKSAEKKKKISGKIYLVREKILHFLEEKYSFSDMDIKSFSVSYLIRTLPLPNYLKAIFRKIKLSIEEQKDELTQVAFENKKYVGEYLSVIDEVMSVVVDNSSRVQYNQTGVMPGTKAQNCLLHAEV